LPDLYLHIGHPKTGSTALQVTCARSASRLADNGIIYPEHKSTALALAGKFTGGNVTRTRLVDSFQKARTAAGPDKAIFYSCEGLFDDLAESACQIASLKEFGIDISILMFVRNPVEYALSFYQQKVKGAGYARSVDDFLSDFDQISQTEVVLDQIETLGLPITLYSFDEKKQQIIQLTEDWLGVPKGVLERLNGTTVNRSSTRAEQAFLSGLSARLGPSGSDHIGHALANELPQLPGELPSLSLAGYQKFVSRIEPQFQSLREKLPIEIRYEITAYEKLFPTEPVEGLHVFSSAQIDVITNALSTRAPDAEFAKEFIHWVKEANEGDVLSAKDIFRLNRLGQILRPGNFPEQRMARLKHKVEISKNGLSL